MNKKFSTLIACVAMLFAAFTVNAQTDPFDTGGKYVRLKSTVGDVYLFSTTHSNGADSIVVKTLGTSLTKAQQDSALWLIKAGVNTPPFGVPYTITNKATGKVLSFAAKANPTTVVKDGVNAWKLTGTDNSSFTITATYGSASAEMDLKVDGGALTLPGTGATDWAVETAPATFLTATDLGQGFSVFGLDFGTTVYNSNFFKDKELLATNTDGGWVTLQVLGSEKIGTKDAFVFVDTTAVEIDGQLGAYGAKFVVDTVWAAGVGTLGDTNAALELNQFKFKMDLGNDQLTVWSKNAPTFDEGELDGVLDAPALWVSSSTDGTRVLTVSKETIADATTDVTAAPAPEQGYLPFIKLTKGTPATLPNGDGVYFLKVKDGSKMKYLYANPSTYDQGGTVFADNGLALSEDAPVAYNPAGQWYVVEKDGKYAFFERNYNWGFKDIDLAPMYFEIFAVTGKENTFRVDQMGEVEFLFQKDITAGGKDYHYLTTKYMTPAEVANMAYTLNVKSNMSGVSDVYSKVPASGDLKDYVIAVAQTTIDQAQMFKVEPDYIGKVWNTTGAYPDDEEAFDYPNVGAMALGDTLGIASYKMYKQYTYDYVFVNDTDKSLKVDSENGGIPFAFQVSKFGPGYYNMMTTEENFDTESFDVDSMVITDLTDGKLVLVDKDAALPNYFDLVAAPAPTYEALAGPGHYNIMSAEDDGKMLTMNPTSFLAEVKFPGQELKSTYIDSMFGLWIDTACVEDLVRPTYYITTQNTLSADEKAEGIRYFLVNPAASLPSSYDIEDSKYFDYAQHTVKAVFTKGIVDGADSLKLFKNEGVVVKDSIYKIMAKNPAAVAFQTTANKTLLIENKWADDEAFYLQVVNNVVYWVSVHGMEASSPIYCNPHQFTIEATNVFPTDNNNAEAGFKVYGVEGGVIVQGAADQVVSITNVLGQTIAKKTIGSSYETISAPAGFVFVTINGETVKALVK